MFIYLDVEKTVHETAPNGRRQSIGASSIGLRLDKHNKRSTGELPASTRPHPTTSSRGADGLERTRHNEQANDAYLAQRGHSRLLSWPLAQHHQGRACR